jgi:hypothetical protein
MTATDRPESGIDAAETWIELVNARAVDELVAMYAADARLLPTFSPHFLTGEPALREYFVALTTRENVSVELHRHSLEENVLSGSFRGVSGLYSFRFVVDGVLLTFPSRFTFTFNLAERAPILHHHSSQVPRTLA